MFHQEIPSSNIPVEPYGWPLPFGFQCRIPDGSRCLSVNYILQLSDALACLRVVDGQLPSPEKVVFARGRCTARVDRPQGIQKVGEISREFTEIVDALNGRVLAL